MLRCGEGVESAETAGRDCMRLLRSCAPGLFTVCAVPRPAKNTRLPRGERAATRETLSDDVVRPVPHFALQLVSTIHPRCNMPYGEHYKA
jgi:hypothetical protein